ncbi:MAG: hypothetical protein HGA65_05670, partial [Oscillochloris sp.]|nr:hypothetical protein [Oscillochloris sp.]
MPGIELLNRLFVMRHPDEDIRRRGQNLLTIIWGLIVLTLLSLPISLINHRVGPLINTAIAFPIGALLIVLTHQGYVDPVALLVIFGTTISLILVPVFGSASFAASGYYFIINILIAGVILPPTAIWGMAGLNLLALIITAVLTRPEIQEPPSILLTGINAGILEAFATVIVVVSTSTTTRAFRAARRARAEAQRANQALAETNASLEGLVAERTAALSATLAQSEAQAQALQAALDEQERMRDLITDLSLPVLPIRQGALVVPLVGALDSARAGLLIQRVLDQIAARQARVVILDVTGL